MVVSIIFAGLAGATIQYYRDIQVPISKGNTLTVYRTVTTSSVVTLVQLATTTDVNTATYSSSVEVKGFVYSEVYPSLFVYFIHCLPVAYVACDTYPARVTSTSNFTESIGNSTYVSYNGSYVVDVPNNESYGISVRLASYNTGSSVTALAVLPLYALTPIIGDYNIDCFFPNSNHSFSNINCVSE